VTSARTRPSYSEARSPWAAPGCTARDTNAGRNRACRAAGGAAPFPGRRSGD
jgi:hypothetical protein